MERSTRITAFLHEHGWDQAQRQDFAADFSPRRYTRLTLGARRAILMDADAHQKTDLFVTIAGLLQGLAISAPQVYAADPENGLVLMENFGDRNIGVLIDSGHDPHRFGERAMSVLTHLHRVFKPEDMPAGLPVFNSALLTQQVELFVDAYLPHALQRPATQHERDDFTAAWQRVLRDIDAGPQTLMLRDYMFDNLMDLPDRQDWRSVGVLDFQDAGLGPVAYDIVSLCERVRRDPHETFLKDMIAVYVTSSLQSEAGFLHDCHILSAQRHMRILGVITRLAANGGNNKLAYVPRVTRYLNILLQDQKLEPIWRWMKSCKLDHV